MKVTKGNYNTAKVDWYGIWMFLFLSSIVVVICGALWFLSPILGAISLGIGLAVELWLANIFLTGWN